MDRPPTHLRLRVALSLALAAVALVVPAAADVAQAAPAGVSPVASAHASDPFIRTCDKVTKNFLRLANQKRWGQLRKAALRPRDMQPMKKARRHGIRFDPSQIYCYHASPEGYQTAAYADQKRTGREFVVRMRADGVHYQRPREWKFWDVEVVPAMPDF